MLLIVGMGVPSGAIGGRSLFGSRVCPWRFAERQKHSLSQEAGQTWIQVTLELS